MSNINSAKSASTSSFLTALALNAAVFSVELVAFTILRPHFEAVYEPRVKTPVKNKRVDSLSRNLFAWPLAVLNADYRHIKVVNGMDAYFFVRFLRMMCRVFFPIWLISWAILLPSTSVKTEVPPHSGLDKFVFGNIEKGKTNRYGAHLILVWLFTIWIWYNIYVEMEHFIKIRQQHLISPRHALSAQARTVLITGIPAKYRNEEELMKLYNHLPGGVENICLNRHLKDLANVYDRQIEALNKLESAECALLITATKLHAKKIKQMTKAAKKSGAATPNPDSTNDITDRPLGRFSSDDPEKNVSPVDNLVPEKIRPTHRLPLRFMPFALPFVGQKVDSIRHARDDIVATNELLAIGRAQIKHQTSGKPLPPSPTDAGSTLPDDNTAIPEEYPPLNSAFITFNKQIAAHLAKTALNHRLPYRMAGRYTEVAPEDIIWGNLGLHPYEAKGRTVISYLATAGLVVVWAFPVAFVGIVSNIHALCVQYKWLSWLCKLPSPVVGIIQGILPPVLLAVLMILLPIILRLLAQFEGIPKRTGLELSLMSRFFIFQVVHSFLIVTISSGIIAALPSLINNPGQIPSLLAQNLPLASTFFLTYVLLQALSGTAGGFLQLVTLILHYVKLYVLGSTPRSIYRLKYGAQTVTWGTLFPSITLLVVIGLGYSIIAPIMNGVLFAAFALFYVLYKYLFLWVMEQPMSSDTGGLFFPKAIHHIFVGLYVEQVCLAALFVLARNEKGKPSALAEGAFMIVLIVLTVIFHLMIYDSYGPLLSSLPLTFTDRVTKEFTRESEVQRSTLARIVAFFIGSEYDDESLNIRDHGFATVALPDSENAADSDMKNIASTEKSTNEKRAVSPTSSDAEPDVTHREQDDYGYAHPAASRPQRIVWIAKDSLGLSKEEMAALKERGINASTAGAEMNDKGKVHISDAPPDGESRA